MDELLKPTRGGFLRPFGCAWFIREFLSGNAPYGSPIINPETGVLSPVLSGCQSGGGKISASLDEEFSLAIGQTAEIGEKQLILKFEEILGDSRCPTGATCIWTGEVSCALLISDSEHSSRIVLTKSGLSDQSSKIIYNDRYEITFHVLPYPELGKEISMDEYRLQLMLSRLPQLTEKIGPIIDAPYSFEGQNIKHEWYIQGYLIISPSIWALIIPAMLFAFYQAIKRNSAAVFIISWFVGTYLVWIPISLITDRLSYVFYFYPTIGAVCICISLGINYIRSIDFKHESLKKASRLIIPVYLLASIILFILICPGSIWLKTTCGIILYSIARYHLEKMDVLLLKTNIS